MLTEQYRFRLGRAAPPAEIRSWERSLDVLSTDFIDAGLDDVEVLVEFKLPLSSKRADAVLCGIHPRTRRESYVVVELKQWTRAVMLDDTEDVVVLDGFGERLHPAAQVQHYCSYIHDFVASRGPSPMSATGTGSMTRSRSSSPSPVSSASWQSSSNGFQPMSRWKPV